VKGMQKLFEGASNFSQDLSSWDVSQVTQNEEMWAGADAMVLINKPCTESGNGANDGTTWRRCPEAFLDGDLLKTTVQDCIALESTGDNCCAPNTDGTDCVPMPYWDVSQVVSMEHMFSNYSDFNQDLSRWNTSAVTDMSNMFTGALAFNQDISRWDTSAVTTMSSMFSNTTAFDQDLPGWDTGRVTHMDRMFTLAKFNGDISSWNTSAVTDMSHMFMMTSFFNQDISNWDVGQVTANDFMFYQSVITEENEPCVEGGSTGAATWPDCGDDGGDSGR